MDVAIEGLHTIKMLADTFIHCTENNEIDRIS